MEKNKGGWFREAFYGMFVHYGLYSIPGRGESVIRNEKIPAGEYGKLADRFNPETLDLNDWAKLASDSGMRYMCLTAKHGDGFALWDTRTYDFNSVKTACGRDLVKEYVSACRKHNLGTGIYYAFCNNTHEGFTAGPKKDPAGWKEHVRDVHEQLTELMGNYGKIDYLFYDGCPPPELWDAAGINGKIRQLQPEILISDRPGLEEDVKSVEKRLIRDPGKLWESCTTINDSWAYNYADKNWKRPVDIIKTLFICAHNAGNLLLNVGPMADGAVQEEALDVLGEVKKWIDKNGEALFGVSPHPFDYATRVFIPTARGRTAYIPLFLYYGPETTIAGIGNGVKSARILSTGEEVRFIQENGRVLFGGLPEAPPEEPVPVLALELDGEPRGDIDPGMKKEAPRRAKKPIDKPFEK